MRNQKGSFLLIIIILIAIVLVFIGIYYLVIQKNNIPLQNKTPAQTTSNLQPEVQPTPPIIAVDLPPLYPDITWEATKSSTISMGERNGLPINPSANFDPYTDQIVNIPSFRQESVIALSKLKNMGDYYKKELTDRGWQFTNVGFLEAGFGGPGQDGYLNGDQYFMFGSKFHDPKAAQVRVYVEYTLSHAKRTLVN